MDHYPLYNFTDIEVKEDIARFVRLDNPNGYPFDSFHAHAYNEIMVFIKGGGNHNINFSNHKIKDNSLHLLAANDLHWVERSMHSSGFAIVFKEQYLHKLQAFQPDIDFHKVFEYSQVINLNTDEARNFSFIFKELLNQQEQSIYLLQLIGAFITKLALLDKQYIRVDKIHDSILIELTRLIEKNYRQHFTVSDYAQALNVSAKTLQNRIKKCSSRTVKQLQDDRLLKEAKRLIYTSKHNITEVSFELGFKELSHFTKWFKNHTGKTPTDYTHNL